MKLNELQPEISKLEQRYLELSQARDLQRSELDKLQRAATSKKGRQRQKEVEKELEVGAKEIAGLKRKLRELGVY